MTDQDLTAKVTKHGLDVSEGLTSRNMEDAIMAQVADGKIDMRTALEELRQSNRSKGYDTIKDMEYTIDFIRKLQTDNHISDDEAAEHVKKLLSSSNNPIGAKALTAEKESEDAENDDDTLDNLFDDNNDGGEK